MADIKTLGLETTQDKKKSKRNANAAPWQGKRVQAEGLPPGWLMGRKKRTQGKGYNKYYIQPGTGKVFKSKKAVERFLEQDLGGASNEREEDTPRTELDASEDLVGASNEREEDTPRTELDASEDLAGANNEREEDTPRTELDASEEVDAFELLEESPSHQNKTWVMGNKKCVLPILMSIAVIATAIARYIA